MPCCSASENCGDWSALSVRSSSNHYILGEHGKCLVHLFRDRWLRTFSPSRYCKVVSRLECPNLRWVVRASTPALCWSVAYDFLNLRNSKFPTKPARVATAFNCRNIWPFGLPLGVGNINLPVECSNRCLSAAARKSGIGISRSSLSFGVNSSVYRM